MAELASSLWGGVAGIAMQDQDSASRQLQQLAIQQNQIKTQAEGLELKQAQTAWDAQQQVARRMAEQMDKQGGGSSPVDGMSQDIYGISDSLQRLAHEQFKHGLPNEAVETISKAAQLQESQAKVQQVYTDQQSKLLTDLSTILPTVTDSTSWTQAKTNFVTAYPQEAATKQAQDLIKNLDNAFMQDSAQGTSHGKQAVQTILQSATVKLSQLQRQSEAAKAKQEQAATIKDQADSRKALADADAAEALAEVRRKAGVGGGLPKPGEINAASDAIKGRKDLVGDNPDPTTLRNLARVVAVEAKGIAQDKGIDMNTAMTEAISAAVERGDLKGVPQKAAKASATSKASSELKAGAIADIDALIAEIQKDPTVVGAKGAVSRAMETVRTATGFGKQDTRATEFQSRMKALILKLPKALTGTSKSSKDERALVDDISSALSIHSTPEIALGKLRETRKSIMGDSGANRVTVVDPQGKQFTLPAEQLNDALAQGYKQL